MSDPAPALEGRCVAQVPRGRPLPAVVARPPERVRAGEAFVVPFLLRDPSKDAPLTVLRADDTPLARTNAEAALAAEGFAVVRGGPPHAEGLPVVPLPTAPGERAATLPPLAVRVTLPDGTTGVTCTAATTLTVTPGAPAGATAKLHPLEVDDRRREAAPLLMTALVATTVALLVVLFRSRPRKAAAPIRQDHKLSPTLERLALRLPDAPRETAEAIADALRRALPPRAGVRTLHEHAAAHGGRLAGPLGEAARAEAEARFDDAPPEVVRDAAERLLRAARAIPPLLGEDAP